MRYLLLAISLFASGTCHAGGGYVNSPVSGNAVSPATVTISGLGSGGVVFSSAPGSNPTGTLTVDAANLFYQYSGGPKLGIGTSSPQQILHVLGASTGRAIMVNSPSPAQTLNSGTAAGEIAVFAGPYSATQASMLDILSYSTATPQATGPMFRITNHWENSGGNSSSGTIALGSYVGSVFTDVLYVTTTNAVGINQGVPAALLHLVSSSTAGGSPIVRVDNNAGTGLWTVNQNGRQGLGTLNPATLLHMSSGTLTVDGNGAGLLLSAGGGVATSGQNYIDITNSGFGASNVGWIGMGASTKMGFNAGAAGAGTTFRWHTGNVIRAELAADTAGNGNLCVGCSGIASTNEFQVGGGTLTIRTDGQTQFYQATVTFINTNLTPVVGGMVTCTNCVRPYTLCVGTGTVIGQFREQGTTNGGCY